MISVAYDVTSLAQNRFGGISEVCRQTLAQTLQSLEIRACAVYRRGDPDNLDSHGITPRRVGAFDRLSLSQYDIAHALCHRIPPVRRRKLVYTLYDAWSLYPNKYQSPDFQCKIGKRMQAELRRADAIVSISRTTHDKLLDLDLVDPERCHVIPIGVAAPTIVSGEPIGAELKKIVAKPYVLFVGRLEVRKNLEHVIKAVQPFSDIALVIIGERGFGGEVIERDTLSQLPSGRLHHFGNVTQRDLDLLYRHALALLQPSWEEGFGLPVAEAMIRGCPVITSNLSASAEIAGGAGLLVDPAKPSESRLAIQRLRGDHASGEILSRRGRERAGELSWEKSFGSLLDLYTRLLSD